MSHGRDGWDYYFMDMTKAGTPAPQNSIQPWPYNPDPNQARYDQQHRERMRHDALRLALDSVPLADSDPTGMKTAQRVAAVANFYLDFIQKGYTPPPQVKLPRQRNKRA